LIEIGKNQMLKVEQSDRSGYYLICPDNYEVFLPGSLAPNDLKTGDQLEVFVFVDNKGDEIATAQLPYAQIDQFACLMVQDITKHGAFMDIGLPKDLLVPTRLQKNEMRPGEIHLVRILLDDSNNRLFGTTKFGPYIQSAENQLRPKQTITIVPYFETPLGFKVLVDKQYLGLVYHNEIFEPVVIGQEYQGSVKQVREDGNVDALLRKTGLQGQTEISDKILEILKNKNGKLMLWDKSPPEQIKKELGISKKAFKSAIGILYKKRLIKLENGYIELIDK
jgi:uncharacterized protein